MKLWKDHLTVRVDVGEAASNKVISQMVEVNIIIISLPVAYYGLFISYI
jgi:hypothetical protein